MYLEAKLRKLSLGNYECWKISSYEYLQAAIKNIQDKLARSNRKLSKKAPTPMSSGYCPELDATDELDVDETQYFQELIGILRWAT